MKHPSRTPDRPRRLCSLIETVASLGCWHLSAASPLLGLLAFGIVLATCTATLPAQTTPPNTSQQLTFAGLLTASNQGSFNAVQTDATGNLYLLLDEHDGVRVLKTDPTATNILDQAHLGATGDTGLAMALDPSGNVYVTGTTGSGSLTGTSGTAFPTRDGTTTNSFVAKFTPTLTTVFVTFTGSTETVAQSIAATADAVFVTGTLFAPTLPVTPAGIIQAPAFGSTQNGFVERFSTDGSTLVYATYLSGATGNSAFPATTNPTTLVADASDNAYIAGSTTASGYPTIAALVPRILNTSASGGNSGFLTKLNPDGSGILFSTFIPGNGVSSLALDASANNLLLSGTIALGQFPIASAPVPLVDTPYQVVARIALDGSAVTSSTVVAPGTTSFATPGPSNTAWVDGTLSLPLLPLTPLSTVGTSFATHLADQSTSALGIDTTLIDQTARLGGTPYQSSIPTSLNLNLNAIALDLTSNPIFAGIASPSVGQTFHLPLTNSPTAALPSSLADALPNPSSCGGSLCNGNAAYLARLSTTSAPSLAFSIDTAPIITLRNLGSAEATGLNLTATGFTLATTCTATLPAGSECTILLTGSGPGTLTITSTNTTTQTATIPAISTATQSIAVSPSELDFGVQTANSTPVTRILTITNLGTQPATFLSALATSADTEFTENTSDCPVSFTPAITGSEKLLAPGATCHITLAFNAATAPADGILNAEWTIGTQTILLTGYTQSADLAVSAPEIDFGLQFHGGLHPPRFLYLSNNSTNAIAHTPIALPADAPFTIIDNCPTTLNPNTICQLGITYTAASSTSNDAQTLALDQGLSVLLTGETLPQPGTTGSSVNPSLSVSPLSLTFANPVVVTGLSSETQTVSIQNTGTNAFTLTLALTGDFKETTNCGATLAAGATCTAVLSFAPAQSGVRNGLLAVTAGAGTSPAYVSLSGTATPILAANNGSIAFGGIPVGEPVIQWFKITQPFGQLTAAVGTGDFSVVRVEDLGYGHGQPPITAFAAATTGSCTNCWIGVLFDPTTVTAETATLNLSSTPTGNPYPLTLTGTGLPLTGLILSPLSQDFGPIPLGSSGAPILFTLTNLTSADLTLSTPSFTGPFVLSAATSGGAPCTGSLAINASCFLEVNFAPTSIGPQTGTLSIATSNGTVSAALTGFGSASTGLALNPAALVFNNIPGATSTTQTISLSNTGTAQLQIGAITSTNPAFAVTSTCATLTPSASCTLTVAFTPGNAAVTGNLNIPVASTTGGNTTNSIATAALTGAYTTENSGLQILPTQATYGPAATGTLGITRQFTLNNLTAQALTVQLSLPRQFALMDGGSNPCGGLAPNASCTFNVAFLPITNGDITGSIFAQATPTSGTGTLNGIAYLEGYGTANGSLSVTGNLQPGNLLNFGQVASGQSASQALTLTNTSASATLTIRRITSEWPFLSTSTCGQTLAPTQSCAVTVTYTPLNQVATGSPSTIASTDTGTLVLESDSITSPDLIDLTGLAAATAVNAPSNAAPLVAFTATQSSLTFPSTQVGDLSPPQTINLDNTGTATIHISSLTTTPDFTVQSPCATLVAGASCTLTVYFSPQQTTPNQTARYGAIEIASDASTSLEFLSLIGAATPSGVTLAPTALNFGSVQVGATATLPVQITNNLTVPTYFQSVTVTGDYTTAGTCPATGSPLAPNTSCTVQVTFAPTTTGLRTGTLSVQTDATTLPLTAALTGTGTQSGLTITPAALSFGSILLGASANLTVTLTNAGTAPVTSLQLAITGDYALTAPCPSATLAPNATCTATVTFTPTALGIRPGTLTITSSDPTSPTVIPLTGTGIANGSFLLTVNGSASSNTSATTTVLSGNPATYTVTLTPLNGFSGTVVLNCTPVTPAQYAACSLLPSSITLAGSSQNATATITTLTSVAPSSTASLSHRQPLVALCLLLPGIFFLVRRKNDRAIKLLFWIAITAILTGTQSCGGSGSDPYLRFSPLGTFQYQVSASSTSGVQLTQTVTLNLAITKN
jgi:hypothetical protein